VIQGLECVRYWHGILWSLAIPAFEVLDLKLALPFITLVSLLILAAKIFH